MGFTLSVLSISYGLLDFSLPSCCHDDRNIILVSSVIFKASVKVLIITAKNHGYIQFWKLCCCSEVISVGFNCHYIITVSALFRKNYRNRYQQEAFCRIYDRKNTLLQYRCDMLSHQLLWDEALLVLEKTYPKQA